MSGIRRDRRNGGSLRRRRWPLGRVRPRAARREPRAAVAGLAQRARGRLPGARIPLLGVASAYAVGVALNALVPARGGDAVKIAVVHDRIPDPAWRPSRRRCPSSCCSTWSRRPSWWSRRGQGSLPFAPDPPAGSALGGRAGVAGDRGGFAARRRLGARLNRLWSQARRGGAILRTPARYARRVAAVQAGAWLCRIGVVWCLLAAFGLGGGPLVAALVMILCGVSTVVPLTPGGAGNAAGDARLRPQPRRRPRRRSSHSQSECRPA